MSAADQAATPPLTLVDRELSEREQIARIIARFNYGEGFAPFRSDYACADAIFALLAAAREDARRPLVEALVAMVQDAERVGIGCLADQVDEAVYHKARLALSSAKGGVEEGLAARRSEDRIAPTQEGRAEGFVLVPREITLEMQRAYFDVIDKNLARVETDARFGRFASQEEAYRAMIAAAPKPEGER